jgi:hypothetical protein
MGIIESTKAYIDASVQHNFYLNKEEKKYCFVKFVYDEIRITMKNFHDVDYDSIVNRVIDNWRDVSLNSDYYDYINRKEKLVGEGYILAGELVAVFTSMEQLQRYYCYKVEFHNGFPLLHLINEDKIDHLNDDEIYAYILNSGGVI